MKTSTTDYKKAFIIITSLFFLWGFLTVLVDSLIPRLKDVFDLSYFQAGLVQFAFFIAYAFFSIPAGYVLSRIGYKKGIILGLLIMAFGCLLFYPASEYRLFPIFLIGYFTLAAGITLLQVAANPYVSLLGSEPTASSRLNLAQAFNSLGTTIAPIIGALFLLSDSVKTSLELEAMSVTAQQSYFQAEAATVQTPFLVISGIIVVLAIIFMEVKLPTVLHASPRGGYGKLFSNELALLGVLGIFLYVGAEVAIGSYLVNYFESMNLAPLIGGNETMMSIANTIASIFNKDLSTSDPKSLLGIFVIFYWGGAMIGRFIGAYLTKLMSPGKVLGIFAGLAIFMLILSMSTTGLVSMWTIISVGLFNSIMFPTIFTLTLDGLGDLKPQASGLLCTAIVGGAVIPPLFGLFTDISGFKWALILVALCYLFILYFGWKKSRIQLANI